MAEKTGAAATIKDSAQLQVILLGLQKASPVPADWPADYPHAPLGRTPPILEVDGAYYAAVQKLEAGKPAGIELLTVQQMEEAYDTLPKIKKTTGGEKALYWSLDGVNAAEGYTTTGGLVKVTYATEPDENGNYPIVGEDYKGPKETTYIAKDYRDQGFPAYGPKEGENLKGAIPHAVLKNNRELEGFGVRPVLTYPPSTIDPVDQAQKKTAGMIVLNEVQLAGRQIRHLTKPGNESDPNRDATGNIVARTTREAIEKTPGVSFAPESKPAEPAPAPVSERVRTPRNQETRQATPAAPKTPAGYGQTDVLREEPQFAKRFNAASGAAAIQVPKELYTIPDRANLSEFMPPHDANAQDLYNNHARKVLDAIEFSYMPNEANRKNGLSEGNIKEVIAAWRTDHPQYADALQKFHNKLESLGNPAPHNDLVHAYNSASNEMHRAFKAEQRAEGKKNNADAREQRSRQERPDMDKIRKGAEEAALATLKDVPEAQKEAMCNAMKQRGGSMLDTAISIGVCKP